LGDSTIKHFYNLYIVIQIFIFLAKKISGLSS